MNAARDSYGKEYNATHMDLFSLDSPIKGRTRIPPRVASIEKTWVNDPKTNPIRRSVETAFDNPKGPHTAYAVDYPSGTEMRQVLSPRADYDEINQYPAEFRDVEHYNRGNYEYQKGKGWQLKQNNEALLRRVTESVLRKLREATQMDNDDSMFQDLVGKFYHEIYRNDRSTPKTTSYLCLPITDVRELESGIVALILDNKKQANFWPEQLKGILNGTYTPSQNMKLFIADKNHWDIGEKEEYD